MINESLKRLNNIVRNKGGKLYLVGGCVRDKFLDRESKDIDVLVTGIDQGNLEEFLYDAGFYAKLVGKSFGVFKLYLDDCDLDIALPRKERSTGDGHKDFELEVDKSITIEEDLARRDFTLNSMAIELGTDKLIDPFKGKKDLDRRVIRQISNDSIKEDYLRALRAIQFASRFDNFIIEKETFANIVKYNNLLETISPERIRMELEKLLLSNGILKGFNYLLRSGLLKMILPEVEMLNDERYNFIHHKYNTYLHTLHSMEASEKDLEIRLALLLHDTGKPLTLSQDELGVYHNYGHEEKSAEIVDEVLTRLKFDSITINNVKILVANHMQPSRTRLRIKQLMSKYGNILTKKIFEVVYYDKISTNNKMDIEEFLEILKTMAEIQENNEALKITDLAIGGEELLSLGYKGKVIGDVLKYLLGKVLEDGKLNTKEKLIELIGSYNG